jgi:outer membrane protein assembly factor BamB
MLANCAFAGQFRCHNLDAQAADCGRREQSEELPTMDVLKVLFSTWLVAAGLWSAILPANAQVNVTQFHNNSKRDGLYIDSAFTLSTAANLARDMNFDGTIVGNVLTQPLYIEGGPSGPIVIAVTESNNVYALNAVTGAVIWQRNVGAPVPEPDLPCTEVGSMGIIGTPVVDLASRALFLDAMITPDGGTTIKHYIISLNVDTGAINPGWPVDVELTAQYNGISFIAAVQQQRPALAIVGNTLYVAYGSMKDCDLFHGWLVGVPINNPASVTAWAAATDPFNPTIHGGAMWGVGGVASDGSNLFITTGNTINTGGTWNGGEAVIRFQPGPVFSGNPIDYWAPTNWFELDGQNRDLGSSGPLLVDVPGATPSNLVIAMGKDDNAYLLNRSNLGGITNPIASAQITDCCLTLRQAAAAYRTNQGTYVAFRANSARLSTFQITATSPPAIVSEWSVDRGNGGCGSPFVTSTDGTNNMIVWVIGTGDLDGIGGDQRLHAYDGDTGAVVYAGGGANEMMASTRSYSTTGIAARGRIYVAADNKVYAFKLPGGTPTPTPTATATATPTSTPATVKIKVRTNPVGRTFSVDGTTYSSQQRFTWISGSSHTIATTSPQSGGSGVQYVWNKWNDNGTISHVVAPTTNKTYTAQFQTQYFLTMSAGAGGAVQPTSSWRVAGSNVVIKARANPGFTFVGWSGSGTGSYTGTNNPVSIMMNGPITETGNFSP